MRDISGNMRKKHIIAQGLQNNPYHFKITKKNGGSINIHSPIDYF